MAAEIIKVVVFDSEKDEAMPENLQDAIEWLQAKLEGVPEEYRFAAKLEIEGEMDYDMPHSVVTIAYSRPETAEEEKARLGRVRGEKERVRQQELATLARLRAKYEAGC